MKIVGGGLAGCVLASLIPDSVIYERDKVGGVCRDNKNYQEFVHILHTDNQKVWDFVNAYTTVKPHRTLLKASVKGELKPYPPLELTDDVFASQYVGYSRKMWKRETPPEAKARITTSPDGRIFHEQYEGVPDFKRFFKNITKQIEVIHKDVKDGDLDGKIILTGPIDEYFNYCYGKLPYRGMQSVHYESEIGLDGDFVTFSDENIPFQRLVDYGRLGYEGQWIGVESACNARHYPIRDEESEIIYNKYKKLAEEKGILLCGRLATFHYLDMDQVIENCMEVARNV